MVVDLRKPWPPTMVLINEGWKAAITFPEITSRMTVVDADGATVTDDTLRALGRRLEAMGTEVKVISQADIRKLTYLATKTTYYPAPKAPEAFPVPEAPKA